MDVPVVVCIILKVRNGVVWNIPFAALVSLQMCVRRIPRRDKVIIKLNAS